MIECIPNFSEGRDKGVLAALEHAAGGTLLDIHADPDHNRSVFTLIGNEKAIAEAVFAMAAEAVRLIDLNKHEGEHPRMGAVDVIPFVPLKGAAMSDCVALANEAAKRIARELSLPVFLYEETATAPERKNLAEVRRHNFAKWQPDYGPPAPHPTAGAVAVSARKPLIAFNINLATPDINIAKKIAEAVRGSSGGLAHCKALGMYLHARGIAQVSMNLTDYEKTPIHRVFELVRTEAARYGTFIAGSELVGLAPSRALFDCAEHFLQMEGFDSNKHVIENAADRIP